ncbi:MerR family transcriptional regulator [Enemella evansiae]|uniref:MerR family transcriptional regulator n=1 Tax=Enemella evansiae TaxID=2016499 RepID=UPI000B974464|nr:MerR family transcriptional regulator [Enemella evansiae]OYO08505.1 MerR family transcriptional regulator [Enemella evansiae]TDO93700.1 DNA-binding transcriptional MerR regulator [Enemella evansiae]
MQELSIGELARASGLTVKRLRHYHDIGVLPAARTDPASGYRWYHPDQVADAVLLQRLRASGVPLPEVGEILSSPERRHDLVIEALRRTRSALERARDRVDEAALLLESLPEVPLAIRRIPDQWVCTARAELTCEECPAWFGEIFPRLYAAAGGLPVGPVGACYGTAFFEEGRGPVQAIVPVVAGTPGAERLPGGTFAVAVHDGSYDNFQTTYAALAAQLHTGDGKHRAIPDGDMREHYLIGPTETPEPQRWRSEVCWPVEP